MTNNTGGGLIALLLVIAILMSLGNSPKNDLESPQTVCGDSLCQDETCVIQEDNDGSQFIITVVIVFIVIFIIYCIADTDNQSHDRR